MQRDGETKVGGKGKFGSNEGWRCGKGVMEWRVAKKLVKSQDNLPSKIWEC